MSTISKKVYWEVRKEPSRALEIIGAVFLPGVRERRKYESETNYWRRELDNLKRWFHEGETDWWGVPPVAPEVRDNGSEIWATNAITTLHRRYPHCLEELRLEADACSGQRILEVGCGPLVPILQFKDCERHGIDPLATAYVDSGWPLYDLDAKLVQGFGEKMPYPAGYFDTVVSRNSLGHVDDVEAVAQEIIRVLKPSGRFVCAVDYQAPTREEPHQLDDYTMRSLFSVLEMKKVADRSKAEIHADLARRFGILLESLNRRNDPNVDNRFTVWHGTKW